MSIRNGSCRLFLYCAILLCGCARIMGTTKETAKVIWGSSTKALEESRQEALKKSYPCPYDTCFADVLGIAKKNKLEVFIKDKRKGHIILMKMPKSEGTTEVGIFFVQEEQDKTTIEITSLSRDAKLTASEIFFVALDKLYLEKK